MTLWLCCLLSRVLLPLVRLRASCLSRRRRCVRPPRCRLDEALRRSVPLECLVFFFFSSRRRHTRCLSDWRRVLFRSGHPQTIIRYREDSRIDMCLILVENLNDVTVGRRIRQLEHIGASRQNNTRNLDRLAECQDGFLVPSVCLHAG